MQRSKLGMRKSERDPFFNARYTDNNIKAEVLSDEFASVFTDELNLVI